MSTKNGAMSDTEITQLSKKLSYVLRHGAQKEKIPITDSGYVTIKDLFAHKKFKNVTFEQIQQVVEENDKKRFELTVEENGEYIIRASQGHTIKSVKEEDLLDLLQDGLSTPVIHGTTLEAWRSIKEQGLSKMDRNHIHCATGLPDDPNVKSGMRKTSGVFIYIDIPKAKKDGVVFYKSKNGVILTDGINGILAPIYFSKVIDRKGDSLI